MKQVALLATLFVAFSFGEETNILTEKYLAYSIRSDTDIR